jgi:hypothetical protein
MSNLYLSFLFFYVFLHFFLIHVQQIKYYKREGVDRNNDEEIMRGGTWRRFDGGSSVSIFCEKMHGTAGVFFFQ